MAEWEVKETPVIFEGVADSLRVEGWPPKPVAGETFRFVAEISVTFSSVHFYRGEGREDIVVKTGMGGGDCGYEFEPGQKYLVFADKEDDGSLSTGICSGTTLLEGVPEAELRLLRGDPPAPDDLIDWRNNRKSKTSQLSRRSERQVCGRISAPNGTKLPPMTVVFWPTSMADIAMFHYLQVDSGPDGRFCLDDLSPGKYLIGAIESEGTSHRRRYVGYYPGVLERSQAAEFVVGHTGAVQNADFSVQSQPLRKIHGYLRGMPEGLTESLQIVLLSPVHDHFHVVEPVEVGPHGFFDLAEVPPGRYTVFAATSDDNPPVAVLSSVVDIDVVEDIHGLRLDYVPKKEK